MRHWWCLITTKALSVIKFTRVNTPVVVVITGWRDCLHQDKLIIFLWSDCAFILFLTRSNLCQPPPRVLQLYRLKCPEGCWPYHVRHWWCLITTKPLCFIKFTRINTPVTVVITRWRDCLYHAHQDKLIISFDRHFNPNFQLHLIF